jgi:hypothetical protein
MTLMSKVVMLKQKKIPSTIEFGADYSDVNSISERSLVMLLPSFSLFPDHLKRDLFDFFTMGMLTEEINRKLQEWDEVDPRSFKTTDDAIKAITLYEDIESHYTSHFSDELYFLKSNRKVLYTLEEIFEKENLIFESNHELPDSLKSKYLLNTAENRVRKLKFGRESPLRILGYLVDLSKRVPPFVRDSSKT